MKQTFEEADKNGDGLLNIDEIYQLLHKMNVNLPRRKVKQMFQVRAILRGESGADNLKQQSQPYGASIFLCVIWFDLESYRIILLQL